MNIRTFVAKSAIWFSENEGGGGGLKAVWNFSKYSSVLVAPSVPYSSMFPQLTLPSPSFWETMLRFFPEIYDQNFRLEPKEP